jgi:hypothetical protein
VKRKEALIPLTHDHHHLPSSHERAVAHISRFSHVSRFGNSQISKSARGILLRRLKQKLFLNYSKFSISISGSRVGTDTTRWITSSFTRPVASLVADELQGRYTAG